MGSAKNTSGESTKYFQSLPLSLPRTLGKEGVVEESSRSLKNDTALDTISVLR